MHNSAFAAVGYNGIYLAFNVVDIAAAVAGIRALGIKGVSITMPFKESVMDLLDDIDEPAEKIGSVNTVINRKGRLKGYNSDGLGAVKALMEKTSIKEKNIVILGAGGSARAIGIAVVSAGGRLTIANRTVEKGERLARELGANFSPLSDLQRVETSILINATSVGMTPRSNDMPVGEEMLERDMVVMDIVYSPVRTRLLSSAEVKGCRTIDGIAMLVNQGALQFEWWTGVRAPVEIMKKAVYEAL
jgi:shikimate dehydrogenase